MIGSGSKAGQNNAGFTIVELIVIIIVVAILAALTIVSYNLVTQNVREQAVRGDLQKAITALNSFKADNGVYPSVLSQLDFQAGENMSYQYSYKSTDDSFCITASGRGADLFAKNGSRETTSGGCPGHGVGGVAAITNLALNPSIEVDTSGASGYFSSPISRVSGGASGSYSLSTTTNSTTQTQGIIHRITTSAKPDQAYSCSVSVKGASGTVVRVSGRPATAADGYLTENLGGTNVTLSTSWQVVNINFTTPANTGILRLQIVNTAVASGVTIQADAFICVEGSTTYKFADGASPNWAWNGAPNASSSTGPAL